MAAVNCVVFFLCVLALTIHTGFALRCYSCTDTTGRNNDCEVNPKRVPSTYCGAGYNYCMNLVMYSNITRTCSIADVCSIYAGYPGFRSCSICAGDYCNGATMTSPLNLSLGLGIAAFIYVTKAIMY